jgi:hypothetical protein
MRGWLLTRGRALLSLLSDAGGALAFVVFAIGLIAAALTGTVLLLLDAFPQPFFTLLVLGMALLAAGLALHFLRAPLTPPPAPASPPPSSAIDNPYSRAAALERRHENERADAEARNRQLEERRAIRRVREELLDNKHVLTRIPGDMNELLSLRFHAWTGEQTTLLEQDDPIPHVKASAAYRELYGLSQSRVGSDEMMGEPYTYGDPPSEVELAAAATAIDEAVEALLRATADGQNDPA